MPTKSRCLPGLIRKIRNLSQQELAAVEAFVEFLSQREDRQLAQAAGKLPEKALRKVWDNPADAAYDRLLFRRIVLIRFPHKELGRLQPADLRALGASLCAVLG